MTSQLSLKLTSQCQLLATGKAMDLKKSHIVNTMMAPSHSSENRSPDAYTQNIFKLLALLSVHAAH